MNRKVLAILLLLPIAVGHSTPVLLASQKTKMFADTGNQTLLNELAAAGISANHSDYSFTDEEGIIGYGLEGSSMLLYWMGSSTTLIPDSVFWSESLSDTTYKSTALTVRNSGVNLNWNVRCFTAPIDFSSRSKIFINSLYYKFGEADSVLYPVSKEISYDTSTKKFSEKYEDYLTVTDKLVSFWNTYVGDSIIMPGLDGGIWKTNSYSAFTEHYVAFNLDTTIDEIKSIDIVTQWDSYVGDSSLSAGGRSESEEARSDNSLYRYYSDDSGVRSNVIGSIDSFGTSIFTDSTRFNMSKQQYNFTTYHVVPNDVSKSSYFKVFGFPFGKLDTSYSWNQIMDFSKAAKEGDSIATVLNGLFGKKSYSQISKAMLNPNGTVKWRWFVQYYENQLMPDIIARSNIGKYWNLGSAWDLPGWRYQNQYYFTFSVDHPFRVADNLSIVRIRYIKNGKEYDSVVVDKAASSTSDPVNPFVKNTDGAADWSWLFWIIVALFGGIALAILVSLLTPAITAGKGIFKVIGWVLKAVVIVLYDVLIWWWIATLAKANGKEVPAANPFAKKGKK